MRQRSAVLTVLALFLQFLGTAIAGDYSFAAGLKASAPYSGTFVWADSTGAAFASTTANQFLVRASGGVTLYTNSTATFGAALAPGSGSWSVLSDRNLKANFSTVDGLHVLDALAGIPIETWNYQSQPAAIRHIGPMAQDFHAAFGVGENDTTISTVDAQGVALAAIQGLYHPLGWLLFGGLLLLNLGGLLGYLLARGRRAAGRGA